MDLTVFLIRGVERNVLLTLAILFEFAAIGAWHSISSRWSTEPQ